MAATDEDLLNRFQEAVWRRVASRAVGQARGMKHLIDPKIDCVFEALLGAERNRRLLIHFLNAILTGELAAPVIEVEAFPSSDEKGWRVARRGAARYNPPFEHMARIRWRSVLRCSGIRRCDHGLIRDFNGGNAHELYPNHHPSKPNEWPALPAWPAYSGGHGGRDGG